MKNLLNKNVLTVIALAVVVLVVLIALVAAITGNYDSASVRALIDDLKYLAAALGGGVAVARGLIAAAERFGFDNISVEKSWQRGGETTVRAQMDREARR